MHEIFHCDKNDIVLLSDPNTLTEINRNNEGELLDDLSLTVDKALTFKNEYVNYRILKFKRYGNYPSIKLVCRKLTDEDEVEFSLLFNTEEELAKNSQLDIIKTSIDGNTDFAKSVTIEDDNYVLLDPFPLYLKDGFSDVVLAEYNITEDVDEYYYARFMVSYWYFNIGTNGQDGLIETYRGYKIDSNDINYVKKN